MLLTGVLAETLVATARGILRVLGVQLEDREATKQVTMDEVRKRLALLTDEFAQINTDAESALSAEVAAAQRARAEAENAAALATMSDPERRATEDLVESAVDRVLRRRTKEERRFQMGLAGVSFVAGGILSLCLTLFVQWLSNQ
jgi:hypothetical protein